MFSFIRKKEVLWSFLAFSLLILPLQINAQGTGTAPPRPECSVEAPCQFNDSNGLEGARIVLFDPGSNHSDSKRFLREALTRLSNKYGFIVDRRSNINDLTDSVLSDAKVIIYGPNDGNAGGAIPKDTVRELVENFVKERGWGLLLIHAACAFIDSWIFLQDACIQQYFHHNSPRTQATLYVEDRTVDGEAHGRANPFTSFLFKDLPDQKHMRDEWFTWRGNPRTTHQYNRQSFNKIMLTALDETTFNAIAPRYPGEHYIAWTHTMGNGNVIFNAYGHDDVWGTNDEDYGDELLGRYLRYVAKDWGPLPVCRDSRANNFIPDSITAPSDSSLCTYTPACPHETDPNYKPDWPVYSDAACSNTGIFTAFKAGDFFVVDRGKLKVKLKGGHSLEILKPNGEVVWSRSGNGPVEYSQIVDESGVYIMKLSRPGQPLLVRKWLVR